MRKLPICFSNSFPYFYIIPIVCSHIELTRYKTFLLREKFLLSILWEILKGNLKLFFFAKLHNKMCSPLRSSLSITHELFVIFELRILIVMLRRMNCEILFQEWPLNLTTRCWIFLLLWRSISNKKLTKLFYVGHS